METLSALTVRQLEDGICLRAGRIAAAQAELLAWIAEFDRRQGWSGPGMLSCAHWLSWRVGLSGGAAREQVRVARRLEELRVLREAFADGRVSYSKVRAISRVAEPEDGIDWVSLARHSSAAQLEKLAAGVARARSYEEDRADPEWAAWRLRTRVRYDDRGGFTMTISGPAHLLPVVREGLDARKAELAREQERSQVAPAVDKAPARAQTQPSVTSADDGGKGGVSAETPTAAPEPTDADALVSLAQDALTAEQAAHPTAARRRRPQLSPQIDPLSGWARQTDGELLPPSSVRAVLRSLPGRGKRPSLRPVTSRDCRRHDLGRTRREASLALRELLGTIDGERCRFPGCTRRRNLHAHHLAFWSDGGGTDLDNLVVVCARHHTLVHATGFALVLHPDRRLEVRTADGVPVLHHPAQPWGDAADLALGPGQHVTAQTLPPDHCDARMDLGYAVSVLLAQAA